MLVHATHEVKIGTYKAAAMLLYARISILELEPPTSLQIEAVGVCHSLVKSSWLPLVGILIIYTLTTSQGYKLAVHVGEGK